MVVDAEKLHHADLRDADLSGADLRDADLRDADLSGADLRDADLSGADLRDADLRDADLSGADLRDADLRGADLRDADLRRADLSGVLQAMQLGQPDKWQAWTYLDVNGFQRIRIGCRDKTLAEAFAHWAGKSNRQEVLVAVRYADAIGRIRGWKQE
ncbi:MAG: pentapeptide repeat-containing protein [Candidatus Limnocylindrales bacterium]